MIDCPVGAQNNALGALLQPDAAILAVKFAVVAEAFYPDAAIGIVCDVCWQVAQDREQRVADLLRAHLGGCGKVGVLAARELFEGLSDLPRCEVIEVFADIAQFVPVPGGEFV